MKEIRNARDAKMQRMLVGILIVKDRLLVSSSQMTNRMGYMIAIQISLLMYLSTISHPYRSLHLLTEVVCFTGSCWCCSITCSAKLPLLLVKPAVVQQRHRMPDQRLFMIHKSAFIFACSLF